MSTSTRRASPTLVAIGVLVALVAVLLIWQRPWTADEGSAPNVDDSELDARLRAQLTLAADATDAGGWTAGFGPGGAAAATTTWRARETLGVDDVSLTLVSVADAPDRDDGSRSAAVRVTWTVGADAVLGPADEATVTIGARVRGAAEGDAVDVLGFEARTGPSSPDPLPLWLSGDLTVTETGAVSLVTVDTGEGPGIPDAPAFTAVADAQVSALTGPPGRAVVVVPTSSTTAAALLGRSADGLGAVAGVATTLPGSGRPAVVLNPAEFDRMDPRGRQLVVTHELTHAMTGAVGTSADTWLVEGFADWVALHEDTAPLAIAAGALLPQVAASGPPDALPTDEDLAGPTSGAAYQGAWLAIVVLAREHGGDAAVIEVYRSVLAGVPVEQALGEVGTSVEELTAQWQDYLVYSASTVS